ncbi:hypothetical protein Y882_02485 [Dyella japonica DSM 16301]|uniref:Uncharacterized protein n=1 Tax=Dyella japonica DSM 16301 TaxID=1440762 RepID=A0A0G9HD09_9GAMM|nr:hypothetical protein Y882_02485 [Dyella japonica DSM 16301]
MTLVCVLHALFALALWLEMQPKPQQAELANVDNEQALIVRLIDHPKTPRPVPASEPSAQPEKPAPPQPALAARAPPITHEKTRRDAMVVQDHATTPAPTTSVAMPSATSLFAKDGSVHLPSATDATSATANTKPEPPKPADDRQIMQHDSNHMQYKATRFEKYFPPPNETAGGAVGRHIGDVIKEVAKSVCDPTKSSTATNLLCGAPPPPASSKDRDERLNLPPAPLADNPNPPKGPPLSSCIDEYKAGEPLSSGCPVNTPDLAFKAEMRECIDLYREGKRLKSWCPLDTPKRAAAEAATPADAASPGVH